MQVQLPQPFLSLTLGESNRDFLLIVITAGKADKVFLRTVQLRRVDALIGCGEVWPFPEVLETSARRFESYHPNQSIYFKG